MQARLSLRTQTRVAHQLVMASRLLRACGAEIESLVSRELAANPALELTHDRHPIHPFQAQSATPDNASPDGDFALRPAPYLDGQIGSGPGWGFAPDDVVEKCAAGHSTLDRLMAQIALMVGRNDLETVMCLVQSLDDYGYLRAAPEELALELGVDCTTIERLIGVLHQLEPPGIGARDLRECFLIQCAHLETEGYDVTVPCRIIREAWDDFVHQRWGRVARDLCLAKQDVEDAWQFTARNLYPYPLLLVNDDKGYHHVYVEPDLIIRKESLGAKTIYSLELPQATRLELRISDSFRPFRVPGAESQGLSSAEQNWTNRHIERARVFIASLEQRWHTLRRLGDFLINYQLGFLEHGAQHLKPLTRAAVAAELSVHESTISRAVSDKVIQLPNGRLVPLAQFFDHSLPAKESMRQLLARSRQPLSDREIAERLQAQGFQIARRTVAKYRRQLKEPHAISVNRQALL